MKAPDLHSRLDRMMREDRGRLTAALIAVLGDFDLAEESLSDAVEAALTHWSRSGLPNNPRAWLLAVARRKAIDKIRKAKRFRDRRAEIARLAAEDEAAMNDPKPDIPDERLRLIFTCCHPALDPKSRVALTLRTLGGLTTVEIAGAFLDQPAAMGQRLSRAKGKIRRSAIPYAVPGPALWPERINSVLSVIYLIFNEGYSASSGDLPLRAALCEEAIYLGRMMSALATNEPEVLGLLSMMLTTHARKAARVGEDGTAIGLQDQDRQRWDSAMIAEGLACIDRAVALGAPGPFQIKAAIGALHVKAPGAAETDWPQIAALYDRLYTHEPTPVVALNGAAARAEAGELARALAILHDLAGPLDGYQPFHAARAEYLARDRQFDAAAHAYDRAIALCGNTADRAFLLERRAQMSSRTRPV